MNIKKSGYLVETKSGKVGRTYRGKQSINGKIPVYLATEMMDIDEKDGGTFKFPKSFSDKAILCDVNSLKVLGFIN